MTTALATVAKPEALYGKMVHVAKADVGPAELARWRKELTVQPAKNYAKAPDKAPVLLYRESASWFAVPRAYFDRVLLGRFDPVYALPDHPDNPWRRGTPPAFARTLHPDQERALVAALKLYRRGHFAGGILKAPCGWGKTIAAIAILAALGARTLIVVHKEFLVRQWRERLAWALPEASVGHLQRDVCDYRGRHVVIAMVHSLAERVYPSDVYDYFDLVIADECHRVGAADWAPVPGLFAAPWRMGITATPRRADKAESVFLHQIGGIFYHAQQARLAFKVRVVRTGFRMLTTPATAMVEPERDEVLPFLCSNVQRNETIAYEILAACRAGRKLLVLSERLEHLHVLEATVSRCARESGLPDPSMGYMVGGVNAVYEPIATAAQVVLATFQYASEALDIPALDTVVFATPMSEVEQAVGRIRRPHPGKKTPIAVDIVDPHVGVCVRAALRRAEVYASLGCPLVPPSNPS